MNKTIYSFITGCCITFAAAVTAYGQAGSLDPTFGPGGYLTTDINGLDDKGCAIAIQANGKIVVAGYSMNPANNTDFALVRYNSDGSLDNTFGSGGKVITDFGGSNEYVYSVAIQTDDKIVVAGFIYNGSDPDFALARYNSNGSLDASFGSGGKVTTAFGTSNDYGKAVLIQWDDKIVVAGYSYNGSNLNTDFAIARYNSDGSLDNTFGTGGQDTTDFGGSIDEAYTVAIQSDHKIVVGGKSGTPPVNDYNFALARYNTNGTLDNTFGSGGRVTTDYSANDVGRSVLIQTDQKIVLAGYDGVVGDFMVVRYNTNGSLDNGFGTGGKVTTDFGSSLDYAMSAAIQTNGKIIVAGYTNPSTLDFALARYTTDGSLDNTFDTDGKVTTDFGGSNDEGLAVAIQDDGKIVMAGDYWDSPTGDNFSVARYNGVSVGISENNSDENTITVSPNPFTNEFSIKGTKENGVVQIYDMTGKEIIRQSTFDPETKINSENLLPGIYFLIYNNGIKTINCKAIKQ